MCGRLLRRAAASLLAIAPADRADAAPPAAVPAGVPAARPRGSSNGPGRGGTGQGDQGRTAPPAVQVAPAALPAPAAQKAPQANYRCRGSGWIDPTQMAGLEPAAAQEGELVPHQPQTFSPASPGTKGLFNAYYKMLETQRKPSARDEPPQIRRPGRGVAIPEEDRHASISDPADPPNPPPAFLPEYEGDDASVMSQLTYICGQPRPTTDGEAKAVYDTRYDFIRLLLGRSDYLSGDADTTTSSAGEVSLLSMTDGTAIVQSLSQIYVGAQYLMGKLIGNLCRYDKTDAAGIDHIRLAKIIRVSVRSAASAFSAEIEENTREEVVEYLLKIGIIQLRAFQAVGFPHNMETNDAGGGTNAESQSPPPPPPPTPQPGHYVGINKLMVPASSAALVTIGRRRCKAVVKTNWVDICESVVSLQDDGIKRLREHLQLLSRDQLEEYVERIAAAHEMSIDGVATPDVIRLVVDTVQAEGWLTHMHNIIPAGGEHGTEGEDADEKLIEERVISMGAGERHHLSTEFEHPSRYKSSTGEYKYYVSPSNMRYDRNQDKILKAAGRPEVPTVNRFTSEVIPDNQMHFVAFPLSKAEDLARDVCQLQPTDPLYAPLVNYLRFPRSCGGAYASLGISVQIDLLIRHFNAIGWNIQGQPPNVSTVAHLFWNAGTREIIAAGEASKRPDHPDDVPYVDVMALLWSGKIAGAYMGVLLGQRKRSGENGEVSLGSVDLPQYFVDQLVEAGFDRASNMSSNLSTAVIELKDLLINFLGDVLPTATIRLNTLDHFVESQVYDRLGQAEKEEIWKLIPHSAPEKLTDLYFLYNVFGRGSDSGRDKYGRFPVASALFAVPFELMDEVCKGLFRTNQGNLAKMTYLLPRTNTEVLKYMRDLQQHDLVVIWQSFLAHVVSKIYANPLLWKEVDGTCVGMTREEMKVYFDYESWVKEGKAAAERMEAEGRSPHVRHLSDER